MGPRLIVWPMLTLGEVFSMIVIDGPAALDGELKVQGAKNSTLPLLAATVLCKGQTVLHNCPHLSDVDTAVRILEHLGSRCQWQG